jgi:NAD(P)-dependent dehydrogenase (short-subunit alcohol dehydrogenase family)
MVMALANAQVVVIGGTSGIGLEVARSAAAHGARVTAAGRSPERIREAQSSLGDAVNVRALDMSEEAAVEQFFRAFKAIDHLVVTATGGPLRFGKVVETPMSEIRRTLDDRFWGTYNVVRYAARLIPPTGSVTLFSGGAAVKARAGGGVLSASVAAVEALSRALALELSPVRVNTVRSGAVDTPLLRAAYPNFDEFARSTGEQLPVKRIGAATDLAHAVLFLMENPYVSGSTIDVDGGGRLI